MITKNSALTIFTLCLATKRDVKYIYSQNSPTQICLLSLFIQSYHMPHNGELFREGLLDTFLSRNFFFLFDFLLHVMLGMI